MEACTHVYVYTVCLLSKGRERDPDPNYSTWVNLHSLNSCSPQFIFLDFLGLFSAAIRDTKEVHVFVLAGPKGRKQSITNRRTQHTHCEIPLITSTRTNKFNLEAATSQSDSQLKPTYSLLLLMQEATSYSMNKTRWAQSTIKFSPLTLDCIGCSEWRGNEYIRNVVEGVGGQ